MDFLTRGDLMAGFVLHAGLGLCVALVVSFLYQSTSGQKLPLHGAEYGIYPRRVLQYIYHAQSMYDKGYAKFKDALYRMTTADGEKVVVPLKYLEELRGKPEDQINNAKAHERKLPHITRRLAEEVERTLRAELPQHRDWTSINVNDHVSRIIAIVSGNILVGPPLCYDEEYLHAAMHYSRDISAAIRALKVWPRILRPVAQYFLPQVGVIRKYRKKAKTMLQPLIEEIRTTISKGNEAPDTVLAWMVEKSQEFQVDDDELANTQLVLIMAGIHTTNMTITHMLYDLAAYPECIKDLRDEITSVLAEHGGVLSSGALFQMKLLDSFMLESQRHNPIQMSESLFLFPHSVPPWAVGAGAPVTLNDGTQIPAGVIIEAPHVAIVQDPSFYPDPEAGVQPFPDP
ncbi:Ent-kaurene oxidase [Cytospora mali]|uniref:Ent-kaurene oxidase n=1 Tax=Cytospora mali TaxID=578113 RepID=A0A194V2Y6_CYTMA|nr:Ent-kaurene oxidase [Valsa mali var. pyri (nom. inval.)]